MVSRVAETLGPGDSPQCNSSIFSADTTMYPPLVPGVPDVTLLRGKDETLGNQILVGRSSGSVNAACRGLAGPGTDGRD